MNEVELRSTKESENLDEEDSLRLQLETHAVSPVVQEVLQPQELHAAQRPPVSPEHGDLQLPGLDPQTNTRSDLYTSM